jgi:hypothetical protein
MARILGFFLGVVALLVGIPEANLGCRFGGWPELKELREAQRRYHAGCNPCDLSGTLPGIGELTISCSAGSHAYCWLESGDKRLYIQLAHGLAGEPRAWVEPPNGSPSRILTYQPIMLDPHAEIHQGFHLWTYDGHSYQPQLVPVNPLALWLRHPFPFSD